MRFELMTYGFLDHETSTKLINKLRICYSVLLRIPKTRQGHRRASIGYLHQLFQAERTIQAINL